jgi:hypothetical protein
MGTGLPVVVIIGVLVVVVAAVIVVLTIIGVITVVVVAALSAAAIGHCVWMKWIVMWRVVFSSMICSARDIEGWIV